MTLSQIFSKLNTLDAEVTIYRDKSSWRDADERWGCSINITSDGTELKTKSTAASGDEALLKAFDKLEVLLSSSAVVTALNLPLLGHATPPAFEDAPQGVA